VCAIRINGKEGEEMLRTGRRVCPSRLEVISVLVKVWNVCSPTVIGAVGVDR